MNIEELSLVEAELTVEDGPSTADIMANFQVPKEATLYALRKLEIPFSDDDFTDTKSVLALGEKIFSHPDFVTEITQEKGKNIIKFFAMHEPNLHWNEIRFGSSLDEEHTD